VHLLLGQQQRCEWPDFNAGYLTGRFWVCHGGAEACKIRHQLSFSKWLARTTTQMCSFSISLRSISFLFPPSQHRLPLLRSRVYSRLSLQPSNYILQSINKFERQLICYNNPAVAERPLVFDRAMHSDSLWRDAVSYSKEGNESWQTVQERERPRASRS
jgi:hypothetical protein